MSNVTEKVLIIGASVIDIIVNVAELPTTGQDIYGEHKETIVGGSGFNVQRVLAQLEIPHDFLTPIGKGQYGSIIREEFKIKGIQSLLEPLEIDNGWNISFVETGGERTFLTIPGIETQWKKDWFRQVDLKNYRYIYISGYELEGASGDVIISFLETIVACQNVSIIFDASPRIGYLEPKLLARLLGLQPILHCNYEEAQTILGKKEELLVIGKELFELVNNDIIITAGSEGTYLYDGQQDFHLAAEPTTVIDTIGAGDSHTAGYIVGKIVGLDSKSACHLGNQIARKIVETLGGNYEKFDRSQFMLLKNIKE